MTFRYLLYILIFPLLFLSAGICVSESMVYSGPEKDGSREMVGRTGSALLPVIISGADSSPVKELRTQKFQVSGSGMLSGKTAVPVIFLFLFPVVYFCSIVNRYILRIIQLQTVK
jgi:hypothetical protein